jgi:hypothetical protein
MQFATSLGISVSSGANKWLTPPRKGQSMARRTLERPASMQNISGEKNAVTMPLGLKYYTVPQATEDPSHDAVSRYGSVEFHNEEQLGRFQMCDCKATTHESHASVRYEANVCLWITHACIHYRWVAAWHALAPTTLAQASSVTYLLHVDLHGEMCVPCVPSICLVRGQCFLRT